MNDSNGGVRYFEIKLMDGINNGIWLLISLSLKFMKDTKCYSLGETKNY
jgi:hypothetical protein